MKCLRTLTGALLLGVSAAAMAAADTDTEFRANELLSSDEQYRQTWQAVVKDESRLPEWVMNLTGAALPMRALEDDGRKYLVGQICETEPQCSAERVYVAFSWDKQRAYALMVQVPAGLPDDKSPSRHVTKRWLGDPSDSVKVLLEEQLKADPNYY